MGKIDDFASRERTAAKIEKSKTYCYDCKKSISTVQT